jgi:hypothetical protein
MTEPFGILAGFGVLIFCFLAGYALVVWAMNR